MDKNEFDIDFDFEKEYGFDPKAFLGTDEYDDNIDLSEFSDEELGLSTPEAEVEVSEEEDALTEDFLSEEEEECAPEQEEDFFSEEEEEEDAPDEDEDYPDVMVFPRARVFDEEDEGEEDEDVLEYIPGQELPEEEIPAEVTPYGEEDDGEEAYDTPDDEAPENEDRKERRGFSLPRISLPKIAMPNIFTKFYDLYFAPVLNKELQEEPRDPNNPRRRRRKSKIQIFKEVYLPPIIACVCLVLVLSFVIGSISNAIALKRQEEEAKDKEQLAASQAADLVDQEYAQIMAEAERLAACYDYKAAADLIDSFSGDINNYPDMQSKRAEYITTQTQLKEYRDPSMIPNLSFHVLIEDLTRAMADQELGGSYNRNFVSTTEFKKILNDLYNNGYVLVDFDSFIGEQIDPSGAQQYYTQPIYLPADKQPIMLTETMVNYFMYMVDPDKDGVADAKGHGFASKLVVQNGQIKAEYVDASGNTLVGDYDLVPILETFIQEHPDFSYRGARAILAVTGYEGIFGYRINTANIASKGQAYYDEQVNGAKALVQALRDKGYTLACYTYGNEAYGGWSAAQITADLQLWTQQITPVIGNVDTFVFARTSSINAYNGSAFDVMYDTGFRYFISNGPSP